MAVQSYKSLRYLVEMSYYVTHYCINIYLEKIRKEKAKKDFDQEPNSGDNPTKRKKKSLGHLKDFKDPLAKLSKAEREKFLMKSEMKKMWAKGNGAVVLL